MAPAFALPPLWDPASFRFDDSLIGASWVFPVAAIPFYWITISLLKRIPVKDGIRCVPFELVHNLAMTVLSLTMLVNVIDSLRDRAAREGLRSLFCSSRKAEEIWTGRLGFWVYIFYLTKYVELVDTFILAARKKEILFLHSYHHAIMIPVCWSWFAFPWLSGSSWCALANSAIHTAMYFYYTLATIKIDVWWKRYLTAAQIIQFITGTIVVSIYGWLAWSQGCNDNPLTALFAHAVNISFLLQFVLFYRRLYGKRQAKAD